MAESTNRLHPAVATTLRVAAVVAFVMILAGGFERFYLTVFTIDRAREEAAFAELPFRKMTGLRAFLAGVDAHTPPHARIAIWVPFQQWEGGYGYAYGRASYLLPGKQVVPLLALHEDKVQFANLTQADYLAVFGQQIVAPGFTTTWQDDHGTLMKAGANPPAGRQSPAQ